MVKTAVEMGLTLWFYELHAEAHVEAGLVFHILFYGQSCENILMVLTVRVAAIFISKNNTHFSLSYHSPSQILFQHRISI